MVSFKVEADARARVQGDESLERYPIVAKVKGTGKDGSIGVQVSGDNTPLNAKISMDGPIGINLPEMKSLVEALSRLSDGILVESKNGLPVKVTLGQIPLDITLSVYSPTQETVFKVEIKGSLGER